MVPSNISDNGRRLTEPQEIANAFNKYFVNVATDNQSSIWYSKNDFYDFLPPININVYVYVYLCVHLYMIIFPIILPIIFWPVVFLKFFLLYRILLKIFMARKRVSKSRFKGWALLPSLCAFCLYIYVRLPHPWSGDS